MTIPSAGPPHSADASPPLSPSAKRALILRYIAKAEDALHRCKDAIPSTPPIFYDWDYCYKQLGIALEGCFDGMQLADPNPDGDNDPAPSTRDLVKIIAYHPDSKRIKIEVNLGGQK